MKEKYITFASAALNRAVRTMAQVAVAAIPTTALLSEIDWRLIMSTSILAGVLSVLTSIATGLPEVTETKDEKSP